MRRLGRGQTRHTWRHFFYWAKCEVCDFDVEWTKNALGLAALWGAILFPILDGASPLPAGPRHT